MPTFEIDTFSEQADKLLVDLLTENAKVVKDNLILSIERVNKETPFSAAWFDVQDDAIYLIAFNTILKYLGAEEVKLND